MAKHTRSAGQEVLVENLQTNMEKLQTDLRRLTVEVRETNKRLKDIMMVMSQENNKSIEDRDA
jgi:predicted  nucleic acid-binding Zn-ribbon protein